MEDSIALAKKIIPENVKGKATDLEEEVIAKDIIQAKKQYESACMRMQNVNLWQDICGSLSSKFILADKQGNVKNGIARKGDFIKVDIPGPAMANAGGADWVMVTGIVESVNEKKDEQVTALKVEVCPSPLHTGNGAAHFFKEGASSTFVVRRSGKKVIASYHGRNEVPNTDVDKTTDKIRNLAVAAGAYIGLSELQWKTLIKAFLD